MLQLASVAVTDVISVAPLSICAPPGADNAVVVPMESVMRPCAATLDSTGVAAINAAADNTRANARRSVRCTLPDLVLELRRGDFSAAVVHHRQDDIAPGR